MNKTNNIYDNNKNIYVNNNEVKKDKNKDIYCLNSNNQSESGK
jgi:hypothetical protein